MRVRGWLQRTLHGLIGLLVVHQLLVAEGMEPPWESEHDRLGDLLFAMHGWAGVSVAALLATFAARLWLQRRTRRDAPFYPWPVPAQRAAVFRDATQALKQAFSGRLPTPEQTRRLARAVQGLGLLAVAWMAMTGTLIWSLPPDAAAVEWLGEIHELGAVFVWAYVLGHAGMALLHRLGGHPSPADAPIPRH